MLQKENPISETLPNNINRISKFKSTIEYTKLMILSNNMQSIISYHQMEKEGLGWGNNGMGDRLFGKNVNYTLIYHSGKINCYSENDDDTIPILLFEEFLKTMNVERSLNRISNSQKKVQGEMKIKVNGTMGIFIHSIRYEKIVRPIRKDIRKEIKNLPCVRCGGTSNIIVDHKNDLYNDERVLSSKTQVIDDFQPLCNSCNLRKRQSSIKSKEKGFMESYYDVPMLHPFKLLEDRIGPIFDIKKYDKTDIHCTKDTFNHDYVAGSQLLVDKVIEYISKLMVENNFLQKENNLWLSKNNEIDVDATTFPIISLQNKILSEDVLCQK